MKKTLIILLVLLLAAPLAFADVFVRGHYRSNGTYVKPHYRSNPDGNPYNNWSTKGNVNPYTGQYGTKPAYPSSPSWSPNRSMTGTNTFGNQNDLLGW